MSDVRNRLQGRLILVTGASRGIGAATATRLAELGAGVIRISRSPMSPMSGAFDVRADLAQRESRDAALERVLDERGLPDVIVSNAGSFLLAPLEETSDDLLREQLAINLEAPFAIARKFLPLMRARGHGQHILVGSVADWQGLPGNAAYASSKFGARGLHQVLEAEFRDSGVRCTLISPGPTNTAVWDPVDPDSREGFTRRAEMLRPEDVAEAIVAVVLAPEQVRTSLIRLGPQ